MRTSIRSLAALALLALPVAAQDKPKPVEQPFLWIIEGENPSFLYGTIHLPDERVTTLPAVVTEAIDACDALYCELPMDPASQMGAQGKMMLPKGQTLDKILPEDLFKRAEALMKKKGLPGLMPPLTSLQPWALAMQIQMLDFMKELMSGKPALDALIYTRAQKAKKEVGGLETMDEQLGVFAEIDGVEMLRQTIEQEEKAAGEGKKAIQQLIELYLAGDLDKMEAESERQMAAAPAEYREKFAKLLITDRNHRMVERMLARMNENPGTSYFFAVGTLHYPGEEGILQLMEKAGKKLRRLSAEDAGKLQPEAAGAPR